MTDMDTFKKSTHRRPGAKAGLYLRNGSVVTPGIMTLENGLLFFKTKKDTVFEAPVENLRADFSRYSTLTIYREGEKFVFVTGAYAGALAPNFTEEQLQEIAQTDSVAELSRTFKAGATILVSGVAISNVAKFIDSFGGRGIGIVGRLVGVIKITKSQAQSFAVSRVWAEFLQSQGLNTTMRGTTFAASQRFLWALLLPIFAVFCVAIYLIVSVL